MFSDEISILVQYWANQNKISTFLSSNTEQDLLRHFFDLNGFKKGSR